MTASSAKPWHKLWILPPIILGILVFMWLAGNKQAPTKAEHQEPAYAVRVVTAQQLDLAPEAEGYGAVQPARVWSAVAQVTGRIVGTHPRLRDGEILPQGTLLYQVDPVDYELTLAQAKAEVAELDVQEKNARATLQIEQRNLAVSQRELQRLRDLAKKGTASQSDADSAERTTLSTRASVQNSENTLALLPTQRAVLEAKVLQAERDLANTQIEAPFNLRVSGLQIETDQYISKGQTLFQGDSVDRVEIIAQVAMSALRPLFIGRDLTINGASTMNEKLPELMALQPKVRLDMGNHIAEWDARFLRFSDSVDSETRTMGVVIAVDKPFDKIIPGIRPPLSKGMFVQVLVRGPKQPDRILIPRSSIRNGQVHLVDEQLRLQVKDVEVLYQQGRFSVIKSGLGAGDRVLVSDLIPAVSGMLLNPQEDEQIMAGLRAVADRTSGDGS